ncbi:Phosphatidylinositol-4-phosphate 5-kinase [Plasmopara halstedii]|uniref:Phosphatidylinositol-4-phosphate 5-kinase n=1 Tax=Plasmopara halstedii TaxID=4781 RepID=A0A0P1ASX0_PLAHL|nr:Phosphatidylinositol-4-phosphate 5-kinase [Plasmopara halstedii]CEG43882.1 Phosphatidylinositol-4-phosphate 5-kinase [Plasmopara halstedii]|eukprot:XP_024580251.1 Phosphatidylinositol-4-phosphate 5-kinase [Plasmopara halstedii]
MSDDTYSVTYVDDHPEEAKYLCREGQVKITYANGDTYEGNIGPNRLKHGEGKYTWNERDAEGILSVLATFEGTYVSGSKNGLGKMTFSNGDVYHGEWTADKMTGEGSYMYANGDIYSGRFESGIRSGNGSYEFVTDKSLFAGEWIDDTIANGKWIFKDGGSYIGRFENGMPIGNCTIKLSSGLQQDGEYIKTQATNNAGEEGTVHKFVGGTIVKVG